MPKINRKLTEVEIKNAKPQPTAYKMYDEGGLELLVRPTGTKVWRYPYKLNDKRNIVTLGKHGNGNGFISSAEARMLRDQAKSLIQQGIDPNLSKQSKYQQQLESNENSFEAIARNWYAKQSWAPKHAKNIMSRLEKDVFTEIGRKPIKDVTIRDILNVLHKIESRDALDVAKRITQYCSQIFDFAIAQNLCDSNPALGRAKFLKVRQSKNRPHLTEKELPAFIRALHSCNDRSLTILAVSLLILTLLRPGELRGLRWCEVDEEKALIEIPAKRMKKQRPHLVPLSSQALEIIREIKDLSGGVDLLFPGKKRVIVPISDMTLIKTVKKLTNNKAVPHGFRHTFSTLANEKGYNRDHVEKILAHVEENKVRGIYNKAEYLEQRREILQWWANYLDERS